MTSYPTARKKMGGRPYVVTTGRSNTEPEPRHGAPQKDTALAWLMPTKTATQRMTLAHSLLNLWGSPRWLSMQGYSRPTTAVKTKERGQRQDPPTQSATSATWRLLAKYTNQS